MSVSGDSAVGIAGDNNGYVFTGDHANPTILPREALLPVTEVGLTERLTNLPRLRAQAFVGRTNELTDLDAAFDAPGGVLVRAVHGLGGIGKTALSAHWAATRGASFNPLWWITADSPASIERGLAELAIGLQPGLADALSTPSLRDRAVRWLAAHREWLIVLDNVDDPRDIGSLLAELPHGRFLITSRRAYGWQGLAETVRLGVLTPDESVELLARIVTRAERHNLDGADALCSELGGLPLAIEQAGAFIAQAGITPRDYLGLLAEYPAEMYRTGSEETELSRTVARVWHITLERLAGTPLAGEILRILAWYAPYNIPRSLLDGLAPAPEIAAAVGRLAAYSMISAYPAGIDVHRVVQAVTRTADPDDPFRQPDDIDRARETALAQLSAALPEGDNAEPARRDLRDLIRHADALEEHTSPETDTEAAVRLFDKTGRLLLEQRDFARSAVHLDRALRAGTRLLGPDDTFLLATRDALGHAHQEAGNLQKAVQLFAWNHEVCLRVLGSRHRDTLHSLDSLARVHLQVGDVERASQILTESLAMRAEALGHGDPDTMAALNNLGDTCRLAGDHQRALQLLQWALRDSIRLYGADHPSTRKVRNNLAYADLAGGNVDRALRLLRLNLQQTEEDLGEEHPATFIARRSLATALRVAGETDQAVALNERNLTDSVRISGEGHPDTLRHRSSLAAAYAAAGRSDQALPLFERLLHDCLRLYGGNHPMTARARADAAFAFERAGDEERAAEIRAGSGQAGQVAAAGGEAAVEFVRTEQPKESPYTYHLHRGPDRASALTFLRATPVREEFVYVIVETPEGNLGRDLIFIFDEATGQPLEYGPRPVLPAPILSTTRCGWCESVVVPLELDPPKQRLASSGAEIIIAQDAMLGTGMGYRCSGCSLLTCAFCAPEPDRGDTRCCRVCNDPLTPHTADDSGPMS